MCLSCYKSHPFLLQDNPVVSTACDLNKLLDSIVQQIPNLDEVSYHDVLDVAMIKSAVRVGKVLQALLLPTIHSRDGEQHADFTTADQQHATNSSTHKSGHFWLKVLRNYNDKCRTDM